MTVLQRLIRPASNAFRLACDYSSGLLSRDAARECPGILGLELRTAGFSSLDTKTKS